MTGQTAGAEGDFGDIAAARQPYEERQQTYVERRVDVVESVGVPLTKPLDQR